MCQCEISCSYLAKILYCDIFTIQANRIANESPMHFLSHNHRFLETGVSFFCEFLFSVDALDYETSFKTCVSVRSLDLLK